MKTITLVIASVSATLLLSAVAAMSDTAPAVRLAAGNCPATLAGKGQAPALLTVGTNARPVNRFRYNYADVTNAGKTFASAQATLPAPAAGCAGDGKTIASIID
ncbi:hypothetical protein DK847_01870 [Aestuariivirga litoralis]|uniref:Uncharacterized protein n=1 Tax=Aestuariivirga litoralis TaxID=2650924 RepID=A0A2W2B0Y4_9HYPH|nr:hypothetical protein [Aestuariivirga litoralis]PZF78580.1 hypothetical protein DK847_01870 [Aestuariivirga litoralis]